jgi:predicted DNA-binding protein (MmcQ/YjbR family)
MPGSYLDYPFGEGTAVYKSGEKMFALIDETKQPLSISLKCDPELARLLVERYESVMPGYHLNKKHWVTIVPSGQLTPQEIKDLILHSYSLISSA